MPTAVKSKILYPVPEAAELMSVDRSQVYVMCSTGQLEWVDVSTTGKRPRVRISQEAIDRFIQRRKHPAKRAA